MATVTHPGVAQIHGVESWRGRPCLIVDYLAGGTLADRLRRGRLAPAVSVAEGLADALAALHETGYLHGDVKPSNVGGHPPYTYTTSESWKPNAGANGGALVPRVLAPVG